VTVHPTTAQALAHAEESAAALADLTGVPRHDVAVVLGSGWVPAADLLGASVADLPVTDLSLIHISEPTRPY